MCLAVPARVIEVDPEGMTARVDYLGVQIVVGTALLAEIRAGQFVLVHAGEALQVIDEAQARESIELWKGWLEQP